MLTAGFALFDYAHFDLAQYRQGGQMKDEKNGLEPPDFLGAER